MRRRAAIIAVVMLLPVLAGTVQQQRERLPPPPEQPCDDPVSGDWMAHVYYEHVGQWYMFKLQIRRGPGTALNGTIHSEWWNGDATRESPPACGPPGRRRAVYENAVGTFDGQTVVFNATDWKPANNSACGGTRTGYLLDNFSGALDEELQEFQSLLNADAPEWRDVPTVFRRIRCVQPGHPVAEPVSVAPPPFQPPPPSLGCNCGK